MKSSRSFAMIALSAICTASLALGPSAAWAQSRTRTTVTAFPSPSKFGQPLQLTAEVDDIDPFADAAPRGAVVFRDKANPLEPLIKLGVAALSAPGAGQTTIAAGSHHSCALTNASGVKCWGWNGYAQLGDGTLTSRPRPVVVAGLSSGVVAVASRGQHSCALTDAGAVKCWGRNDYGQVGDGQTSRQRGIVEVSGLSNGVVAVTSGAYHSCALTEAGVVKCWGWNRYGQLGDGTTTDGLQPVVVSGLSRVVAIAAGSAHTCALTGAGAAKCWGWNRYGQIGDGTTIDRLTPVAVSGMSVGVAALTAGMEHNCAVKNDGGAKCWGFNARGQLGDGTTTDRSRPVPVSGLSSGGVSVTGGQAFSCALTGVGGVRCWGDNTYGQLGDGTTTNRLTPVAVGALSRGVVALASGGFHSCASMARHSAQCWGANGSGALGDGTTRDSLLPIPTVDLSTIVRTRARFTTSALAAGEHSLMAIYPGNAERLGYHLGSSDATSHIVRP